MTASEFFKKAEVLYYILNKPTVDTNCCVDSWFIYAAGIK